MTLLQNHKAVRNALVGTFLSAVGLTTSGCATQKLGECIKPNGINLGVVSVQKSTYDTTCAADQSARLMMEKGDVYVRAAGMAALSETQPKIGDALSRTTRAVANQGENTYTVVRNADGSALLVGTPVITAPAPAEQKTPEVKSPAPAPAPAPQP